MNLFKVRKISVPIILTRK